MSIQRFDWDQDGMETDETGCYVRFDSHLAELAALREELGAWKSTAETFEDFYRKTETELDAAEQRNAEFVRLLKRAEPLVRGRDFQRAISLADEMRSAFKPTESGASE